VEVSHTFDPEEVHTTDEITGKDHWLIRLEDGQEVTVIPMTHNLFEAAQWDQNGYGVRVKAFCTAEGVKDFIGDVRGNWGLSNPDVCEEFKENGSCIHSDHTR
jgi:hypothetical protein